MKKVTIGIPVFNQEELVIRALESIPKREDIEVIVIDDGSTDNTWIKLLDYRNRCTDYWYYMNLVLLYNTENKGVGYSVNQIYDKAKGEYVVLLGSDDYFYEDEFNKCLELLDGTDLVYFDVKVNNGDIWKVTEETKKELCGSYKFMRREFIGDIRCPEIQTAEDVPFYKKLLEKNPTEKFTGLVVKHYNHTRENSLTDLVRKGILKVQEE